MRKRKPGALDSATVAKLITFVAFLCLAALGYLWQKKQIDSLGREMRTLEVELENLQRTNERLNRVHATMCSPGQLHLRVREMKLGLGTPHPDQIVRMMEPSLEPRNKEWAASEPSERTN